MGSIPTRSRHPGPGLASRVAPLLVALLLLPGAAAAQETTGDTARSPVLRSPAQQDTAGPPVTPLGAFARSLVLPGWGQVAVDRPGRGAFFFGMEAMSVFMVVKTQAKLDAARAGGDTALIRARTQQREDWIALSVFWALFSGVDAWVSTQFCDYEGAI
ncbi:MAG: hypothetical protein ABEJ46_05425, partial [Gemmatimonadota bacterium]